MPRDRKPENFYLCEKCSEERGEDVYVHKSHLTKQLGAAVMPWEVGKVTTTIAGWLCPLGHPVPKEAVEKLELEKTRA